jgi:hypothetical protein
VLFQQHRRLQRPRAAFYLCTHVRPSWKNTSFTPFGIVVSFTVGRRRSSDSHKSHEEGICCLLNVLLQCASKPPLLLVPWACNVHPCVRFKDDFFILFTDGLGYSIYYSEIVGQFPKMFAAFIGFVEVHFTNYISNCLGW